MDPRTKAELSELIQSQLNQISSSNSTGDSSLPVTTPSQVEITLVEQMDILTGSPVANKRKTRSASSRRSGSMPKKGKERSRSPSSFRSPSASSTNLSSSSSVVPSSSVLRTTPAPSTRNASLSQSPFITAADLLANSPPTTPPPDPDLSGMSTDTESHPSRLILSVVLEAIRMKTGLETGKVWFDLKNEAAVTPVYENCSTYSAYAELPNCEQVRRITDLFASKVAAQPPLARAFKLVSIIKSGYIVKTGRIDASLVDRWLTYRDTAGAALTNMNVVDQGTARDCICDWNRDTWFPLHTDILAVELFDSAPTLVNSPGPSTKQSLPTKVIRIHVTPAKYNEFLRTRDPTIRLKLPPTPTRPVTGETSGLKPASPPQDFVHELIWEDIDFDPCFRCLSLLHTDACCHASASRCSRCGQSHETRRCKREPPFNCHNCSLANDLITQLKQQCSQLESQCSLEHNFSSRLHLLQDKLAAVRRLSWNDKFVTAHDAKSRLCPQSRKRMDEIREKRKKAARDGLFFTCPPKYRMRHPDLTTSLL